MSDQMSSTMITGLARINDGDWRRAELTLSQNMHEVVSGLPRPDPAWQYVDEAGHFHAYDEAGKLPTLDARQKKKECDGSCGGACVGDGYSVTVYRCRICAKKVKPGVLTGEHTTMLPGLKDWGLTVDDAHPEVDGDLATVRFGTRGAGLVWFGVGLIVERSFSSDRPGGRAALVSAGPIGERQCCPCAGVVCAPGCPCPFCPHSEAELTDDDE